jgi:tetratricopeptide (TPR) repeat protein
VCAVVALGIVLVLVRRAPRDNTTEVPEPFTADPTVTLPSTAAQVTVEQLQQEIEQVAEHLRARFAQSPEALHLAAVMYFELLRPAEAEKTWRACAELSANHLGASVGLAVLATEHGDDEAAVDILQRALSAGGSSPEVYHRLAVALAQLGRLEEAEDVLKKGLAAFPQSPGNWRQLGQTQIQLERFSEAETSLRKAISLAPEDEVAYFSLATACARQGKNEEAAEYRRRFTELKAAIAASAKAEFQTTFLNALRRIAVTSFGQAATVCSEHEDHSEAEKLLLRAIALDPEHKANYRPLAELYRELGRMADAQVVQRRLVEIEPDNLGNYIDLATVSSELGDTQSAEAAFMTVLNARPDAAVAYAGLAKLYLQSGKLEQARWFAEEAVRWESSVEGHLLVATICRKMGESSGAESALEEARKLAPHDPRLNQDGSP